MSLFTITSTTHSRAHNRKHTLDNTLHTMLGIGCCPNPVCVCVLPLKMLMTQRQNVHRAAHRGNVRDVCVVTGEGSSVTCVCRPCQHATRSTWPVVYRPCQWSHTWHVRRTSTINHRRHHPSKPNQSRASRERDLRPQAGTTPQTIVSSSHFPLSPHVIVPTSRQRTGILRA